MPSTRTNTSKNQSPKRKHEESTIITDSEPLTKNRKKNRDERNDDQEIDNQSIDVLSAKTNSTTTNKKQSRRDQWYAYESSVYRIDVSLLLSRHVTLSLTDILFDYQKIRDETIKVILQNYEETLMVDVNNPNCHSMMSHGQLHLNESIQYKRNQCKIIEDEKCREAYLCVHSKEFTKDSVKKADETLMFSCDGWLIYRCDRMKGDTHAFSTIHGKMIGDKINTKTLYWLGIHDSHCTIRKIEWEIKEIVDKKKENFPEPASKKEIEQELEKLKATPTDYFIPNRVLVVDYPFIDVNSGVQGNLQFQPPHAQTAFQESPIQDNETNPTNLPFQSDGHGEWTDTTETIQSGDDFENKESPCPWGNDMYSAVLSPIQDNTQTILPAQVDCSGTEEPVASNFDLLPILDEFDSEMKLQSSDLVDNILNILYC